MPLKSKISTHLTVNIFFIWITLFVISSIILLPSKSLADEVQVLLVFEEKSNADAVVTKEHLERLIDVLESKGVKNLIPVFIPYGYSKKFSIPWFEDLLREAGLQDTDKIQTLLIGTHGSTDLKSNKTILEEAGGFDKSGVFGNLKQMISVLKFRTSDNLHISLQACSTLCGTPEQVSKRAEGLLSEFSSGTAKSISVWGATDDLPANYLGKREMEIEILKAHENFKKRMSWLKYATIPFALSYFYASGYAIDHFNLAPDFDMTQILSVYVGIPSALFIQVVTNFLAKKTVGFKGLFVSMKENKIEMVSANHFSKESIHGLSSRSCEQIFLE